MLDAPIDQQEIVITASRAPQEEERTPATVAILDPDRIERLGEPLIPALLRLTPSASVAASGPAGSLTEVRIRGAEANHTLLFVDGIRLNDPASGNQPRFELLNADIASRIEVVRGPQSALWGSEAVGGVVAVNGIGIGRTGQAFFGEAGSLQFRRTAGSASMASGEFKLAAAAGYQASRGIDAFEGSGERDGYRNVAGRLRAGWTPTPSIELGAAMVGLAGRSEFDGYDTTFLRADTLDATRNRLAAGRIWGSIGSAEDSWNGTLSASLLGSSNRNLLADNEINRTSGRRWTLAGQVEHRFAVGSTSQRLIAAADYEAEDFQASDVAFGGASNQERSRSRQSILLEWRAEAGPLVGDLAVRHDIFSAFKDATTVRAALLVDVGRGLFVAGSYGEGIAQPTFFDLFGFSPGFFIGNPLLKAERSRGFEASLRYRQRQFQGSLTWFRQRLEDEIIENAAFNGVLNAAGTSSREGIEAMLAWSPSESLRLSGSYAFLDAEQQQVAGVDPTREARRPRHSASIALDGRHGRFTYGASLAFTGAHLDRRDSFPFEIVRLGSYWLASARLSYAVNDRLDLFVRAANALDQRYEDVFANRTEGRTVYAGIRFSGGR